MRTSKTIIWIILGASGLAFVLGGAGFAADESSVPATAVAAPKFENFDPAKYTGETGKIELPIAGQTAMVMLRKVQDGKLGDYLQVSGKDAEMTVPVGSYRLAYYYVNAIGKNGSSLTFVTNGGINENGQALEIKSGESVSIEAAGQLAASIKAGKTGKIIVPFDGDTSVSLRTLEKNGPGGQLMVSGKSGALEVPTGKYELVGYTSMVTAKDKTKWYINVSRQSGGNVEITPTTNMKFKASSSYSASVKVAQNGDQVSMSLQMAADNGDTCSIRSLDSKAQPPSFKVLSKSGEVLMSGKFAYG